METVAGATNTVVTWRTWSVWAGYPNGKGRSCPTPHREGQWHRRCLCVARGVRRRQVLSGWASLKASLKMRKD